VYLQVVLTRSGAEASPAAAELHVIPQADLKAAESAHQQFTCHLEVYPAPPSIQLSRVSAATAHALCTAFVSP
jgi:hypothetical protein